jgi:hypothetical protein
MPHLVTAQACDPARLAERAEIESGLPDRSALSSPAAAVEALARRLYWNMQRLDPDPGAPPWGALTDRQRRFYEHLVADVVAFEEIICKAQEA